MSDTNYMNAYVNLVMETVHSNLNDILQLKTQTKLLNDLVLEKDQVISSLTAELETARANQGDNEALQAEMQRLRDNAATWETQYNNMVSKASHLDTLAKQYNDLQQQFNELNNRHVELMNINQQHENTINNYNQRVETLEGELTTVRNKLTRLEKKEEKEEKKTSTVSVKKSINKEEPKPISISKPIEPLKETDDDF